MLQQGNVCRLIFRRGGRDGEGAGFVQGMAPWSVHLSRSHHQVYVYRLGRGGVGTWESRRDPSDHHNFGTLYILSTMGTAQ
jgi:hypothetical protein